MAHSSPDTAAQHRAAAPKQIRCGVVTISDTRTPETDRGGDLLCELLRDAGHEVFQRQIVPDEPTAIDQTLQQWQSLPMQAILMTGGTGISPRDQTYETVVARIDKHLPGYGELFRMLSYQEIGAAAMLSRATAGLMGSTLVMTMPGSPAAIRLAMQKLILPELPHLVGEASK